MRMANTLRYLTLVITMIVSLYRPPSYCFYYSRVDGGPLLDIGAYYHTLLIFCFIKSRQKNDTF